MNAEAHSTSGQDFSETDFVARMSPTQRDELFANAVKRRYPKNALIYGPWDHSAFIYCVVNGSVRIYDVTSDGREIIFRFCNPDSLFGVSAVFGHESHLVFAQAVEATDVLAISRDNFENFILRNPQFAVGVIHMLGRRLRQAHAVITEFVVGDVRSRLGRLLLKFSETKDQTSSDTATICNRLTHQEIASMIGAGRTTVTKIMNEWKRHDILRVTRGRIVISDLAALTRMVKH